MASKQLNQVPVAEELLPPLSPISQSINSPILSLTITLVFEFEKPFNKSQTIELLRDVLVPTSPRFSCIIFTDTKGIQRWKKVELAIEDHIIVPTFPSSGSSSSLQDYDKHFYEYLSDISMTQLPENRPPWEVHLIMYPTSNTTMSFLVFRLSHALGDGYSLMSAMVSSFKRIDDPLLPITFPSSSSSRLHGRRDSSCRMSSFISRCFNTVSDSIRTLLQGMFLEDDKTAIRSATPRLEFEPRTVDASAVFDLDEIRQVKNVVGGTVNDVTIGLISFTIQLYMQRLLKPVSGHKRVSALVIMNMRMLKGHQNVEDMLKAKEWGNHFGLLSIPLPLFGDSKNMDPLEFIIQAKKEMRKKMNSAGIYFSAMLMNVLKNIIGSKAVAGLIYSTCKNTSIGISNIIGPMQKVALADNPVNGFYFTVGGVPQTLSFTVMSYMGKLRVITVAEKGFIDCELLISCMKEAFGNILEAAHKKRAVESS